MEVSNSVQMKGFFKKGGSLCKTLFFSFLGPRLAISHGITSLGQRGLDRSRGLLKLKKIPNCTRFYLLLLYLFYAEKARAGHLVLDNFSCMQKNRKNTEWTKKIAENTAWKLSRFFFYFHFSPTPKNWKITAV